MHSSSTQQYLVDSDINKDVKKNKKNSALYQFHSLKYDMISLDIEEVRQYIEPSDLIAKVWSGSIHTNKNHNQDVLDIRNISKHYLTDAKLTLDFKMNKSDLKGYANNAMLKGIVIECCIKLAKLILEKSGIKLNLSEHLPLWHKTTRMIHDMLFLDKVNEYDVTESVLHELNCNKQIYKDLAKCYIQISDLCIRYNHHNAQAASELFYTKLDNFNKQYHQPPIKIEQMLMTISIYDGTKLLVTTKQANTNQIIALNIMSNKYSLNNNIGVSLCEYYKDLFI